MVKGGPRIRGRPPRAIRGRTGLKDGPGIKVKGKNKITSKSKDKNLYLK